MNNPETYLLRQEVLYLRKSLEGLLVFVKRDESTKAAYKKCLVDIINGILESGMPETTMKGTYNVSENLPE